jgi:hypothetical protein
MPTPKSIANLMKHARRTNVLFSIAILGFLTACFSASSHAGIATAPQPAVAEQDFNRWYVYYDDQFDAYKGRVTYPNQADGYPDVARRAYQKAADDYRTKIDDASRKNLLSQLGIGLAAIFLFYVQNKP